ncbi:hypothetical protein Tco_1490400, partial [Tanacetum coccineum]
MVARLPKTGWFSLAMVLNSPCYRNKELASPEQTAPDSPLPGVHTPWDVMRIVCNPALICIPLFLSRVKQTRVAVFMEYEVPTGRIFIVPAG